MGIRIYEACFGESGDQQTQNSGTEKASKILILWSIGLLLGCTCA